LLRAIDLIVPSPRLSTDLAGKEFDTPYRDDIVEAAR
jgi:hypothetical protein